MRGSPRYRLAHDLTEEEDQYVYKFTPLPPNPQPKWVTSPGALEPFIKDFDEFDASLEQTIAELRELPLPEVPEEKPKKTKKEMAFDALSVLGAALQAYATPGAGAEFSLRLREFEEARAARREAIKQSRFDAEKERLFKIAELHGTRVQAAQAALTQARLQERGIEADIEARDTDWERELIKTYITQEHERKQMQQDFENRNSLLMQEHRNRARELSIGHDLDLDTLNKQASIGIAGELKAKAWALGILTPDMDRALSKVSAGDWNLTPAEEFSYKAFEESNQAITEDDRRERMFKLIADFTGKDWPLVNPETGALKINMMTGQPITYKPSVTELLTLLSPDDQTVTQFSQIGALGSPYTKFEILRETAPLPDEEWEKRYKAWLSGEGGPPPGAQPGAQQPAAAPAAGAEAPQQGLIEWAQGQEGRPPGEMGDPRIEAFGQERQYVIYPGSSHPGILKTHADDIWRQAWIQLANGLASGDDPQAAVDGVTDALMQYYGDNVLPIAEEFRKWASEELGVSINMTTPPARSPQEIRAWGMPGSTAVQNWRR